MACQAGAVLTAILCVLLLANVSNAQCSRDDLNAAGDNFFSTAFAGSGMKLSPSAKIAADKTFVSSLDLTAHSNITGFYKNFRVTAIDEAECQIATLTVPTEGASAPAILSLRIKLEAPGGLPSEVEVLDTVDGDIPIFVPALYPDKASAAWTQPQSAPPMSREDLIATANSWAEGLHTGNSSLVRATPNCTRTENGLPIPIPCKGASVGVGLAIPIYSRRWVVDTLTGVVMGAYYFADAPPGAAGAADGLFTHEYFKISAGLISEAQASFVAASGHDVDPWTGIGSVNPRRY